MRLPWKKPKPGPKPEPAASPSFGDLEDFATLRHHAIRALCGALLDRHTACRSPHPFCGPAHRQNGDSRIEFIAEAVAQRSALTGGSDRIGIYLCPATGEPKEDIMEYIASMAHTQPVPTRKLVVFPPKSGVYQAIYGPILNPVEGDYATGSSDPGNGRPLTCNPEPKHWRGQYWESGLTLGDSFRFHCLQMFGNWWVVEVDEVRGLAQQVAGLAFADNPEHN